MQRQFRAVAVPEPVEHLQRSDARVENTVAALRVHVFRLVARHRRDDLDFVFRQKFREAIVRGLQQDREIAAVDDAAAQRKRAHPFDDMAEVGDHFRRAAGEIERGNVGRGEPVDDAIHGFARDDFLALRASVHMAVHAGQVAELADVHLQNLRARAAQREAAIGERGGEAVHGNAHSAGLAIR